MPSRHPSTALVLVTIVLSFAPSLFAQSSGEPAAPDTARFGGDLDARPVAEPWVGWHGPLDDGLLGLRFGMDRFSVARVLRERGLSGRHSREHTLLFGGTILSRNGEILTEFRPDPTAPNGERLSRIQLMWTIEGVPHGALGLFERLDAMLRSRYGEPRMVEEDGFAALDSGWGQYVRGYVGTQAKAVLHLESTRRERYRLLLSLESPQLHVPTTGDEDVE